MKRTAGLDPGSESGVTDGRDRQDVANYDSAGDFRSFTMPFANSHFRQTILISIFCAASCLAGLHGERSALAAADLPAAFSERQQERTQMVETQLKGLGRTPIVDRAVLQAMLKVPRHFFVPPDRAALAYRDTPVPIGSGQTISQPYVVALMTQALGLKHGMKVLEVGTGSGYQAAILAEITPSVFTIEIIRPLYEAAADRLKKLGYNSVKVRLGDGYYGWKEFAPFDRIIVTCAALHIPPLLFEQLKPGGKMVIPVGGTFEVQRLLLVTKDEGGGRSSKALELVRFVPLIRGTPKIGQ